MFLDAEKLAAQNTHPNTNNQSCLKKCCELHWKFTWEWKYSVRVPDQLKNPTHAKEVFVKFISGNLMEV